MIDKTSFPDRISLLNHEFGYKNVALYLGQDETDILKWANSDTLLEAPTKIDYTYFLHKYPNFNKQWLEEGIGSPYITSK